MFVLLSYYSFKVLIVCLIVINREWHTVLSTAIVKSFVFDVVRLQTTNQMLLRFLTQLSCNAHTHTDTCNYIEKCVHHMHTMSTTGGMAREAQTFYKRLVDMLSRKRDLPYSSLMGWLRCKLSFAILRSAIMCIRGSRSSLHHPMRDATDIALACSEGHVPHLH